MNEAIIKAIRDIEAARKPAGSVPWEADKPFPQPLYTYKPSTHSWEPTSPQPSTPRSSSSSSSSSTIANLALFSWNIDFMLPHGVSRMASALAELEAQLTGLPPTTAAVVFLQECTPDDLDVIGRTGWVRAAFARTDVGPEFWANAAYGTTTLVDRRLGVAGDVFRVHYGLTRMERDALFVDVLFPSAGGSGDEGGHGEDGGKGKQQRTIRLCNTHLESLAQEPAYRPPQVALAAKFMHDESVHGALLAGDLNAIQPFDRSLHSANDLRDAYLSLGGAEDSEEGYTWGQQAAPELRRLYGCSRMDKVWYCGGVAVREFARFGQDVEVADEKEKEEIKAWGGFGFEKAWVTDHSGVWAVVDVVG
ncbi:Endonuclease/exonuclease/phosphatase [Xylaria acuta]|nr:Endonuclease/exonuclease/phosphatase [Xylaria acuta]